AVGDKKKTSDVPSRRVSIFTWLSRWTPQHSRSSFQDSCSVRHSSFALGVREHSELFQFKTARFVIRLQTKAVDESVDPNRHPAFPRRSPNLIDDPPLLPRVVLT